MRTTCLWQLLACALCALTLVLWLDLGVGCSSIDVCHRHPPQQHLHLRPIRCLRRVAQVHAILLPLLLGLRLFGLAIRIELYHLALATSTCAVGAMERGVSAVGHRTDACPFCRCACLPEGSTSNGRSKLSPMAHRPWTRDGAAARGARARRCTSAIAAMSEVTTAISQPRQRTPQ